MCRATANAAFRRSSRRSVSWRYTGWRARVTSSTWASAPQKFGRPSIISGMGRSSMRYSSFRERAFVNPAGQTANGRCRRANEGWGKAKARGPIDPVSAVRPPLPVLQELYLSWELGASGFFRGGEEPVIQFWEDRVHVLQGLQLRGVDVPVLQGVQQLVEAVEVVVEAAPGVFFGGAVGDDEGPVGALSEHQLAARLAEGPLLQAGGVGGPWVAPGAVGLHRPGHPGRGLVQGAPHPVGA